MLYDLYWNAICSIYVLYGWSVYFNILVSIQVARMISYNNYHRGRLKMILPIYDIYCRNDISSGQVIICDYTSATIIIVKILNTRNILCISRFVLSDIQNNLECYVCWALHNLGIAVRYFTTCAGHCTIPSTILGNLSKYSLFSRFAYLQYMLHQ